MKKHPADFLVDTVAKYGPLFRLKTSGFRATVIVGPAGRNLIKHEGDNGLHRQTIFDVFASEVGVDMFGVQGESHERLRILVKLGYSRQIPAQFTADMTRTVRIVFLITFAGGKAEMMQILGRAGQLE